MVTAEPPGGGGGPEIELTPTAWAILGFLSLKAQTGYEILRSAKRSMEMFWGVSNGQLYPQLRHLGELGLIRPLGAAEGPRSRQRWEITDSGRAALRAWLESVSAPVQIRDENLAKLFFAGQSGPETVSRLLQERKRIFSRLEGVIDAVLPGDHLPEAEEAARLGAPELLFRYGKHFTKTTMRWVDQEEARLLASLRGHDVTPDDADPDDAEDDDGRKEDDAPPEGPSLV